MKSPSLWQVSVTTAPEGEEAVSALLKTLFGLTPSVYTPEESRQSVITVYPSELPGKLHPVQAALAKALAGLSACGWTAHQPRLVVRRLSHQDWSESWKKHFKPIELGRALLIRPSWSRKRPQQGQAVIVLDPGLSFGTGQHPTTSFCLRQLLVSRKAGRLQSFLDIGTGSGILAIAAAKLGYGPIRAFDNDPVAVRVAKSNARRNRVAHRITITNTDLTHLARQRPKRFDVICANLISDVLIEQSSNILNSLRPEGRLVLSGILAKEFDRVQQAYEAQGVRLLRSKTRGGWRSGTFSGH